MDGDEKVFGFFTGKMKGSNEIFAVRPTNLINVKQEHKDVLKVITIFLLLIYIYTVLDHNIE